MKKIFLLTPFLVFALFTMAQPPEGPANKGMVFGTSFKQKNVVDANELGSLLTTNEPKEVMVKGKVVDVCKAEGCWLRIETSDGTMMIRMKDHAFFVPVSLSGKTIIANGIATYKKTSVELLRHYAEDAGKSKQEIASITNSKKEIVLQAKGIMIL